MKFKPTLVAVSVAMLIGGSSAAFATDMPKVVPHSSMGGEHGLQHMKHKKHYSNNDKTMQMIHDIKNIKAQDLSVKDFSVNFKKLIMQWQDVKFSDLILNKHQHVIDGKADIIKLIATPAFIKALTENKHQTKSNKDVSHTVNKIFPIVMKDVSFNNNYKRHGYLWDGSSKLQVDTINFGSAMQFKGINKKFVADLGSSRVTYKAYLDIDKINIEKQKSGPLNLDFSLNVDRKAIANLARSLHKDFGKTDNSATNLALNYLLLNGLDFKINKFSLKQDDSLLDIQGYINIPAVHVKNTQMDSKASADEMKVMKANLKPLLDKSLKQSDVKLNVKFSKGFITKLVKNFVMELQNDSDKQQKQKLSAQALDKKAEGIAQMVNGFISMGVSQGYLKEKGNMYFSTIVYKNGKLFVNGKQIQNKKKPKHEAAKQIKK